MSIFDLENAKPGDEVFVIYRNPHVPSVANVQAAEMFHILRILIR